MFFSYLENNNYIRKDNVWDMGEFSIRGDVIDFFPYDENYIPDSIEPSLGFDPNLQSTYGDYPTDFGSYSEPMAYDAEHTWKDESADSEDWANPGKQTYPKY
jgi:hypothetical protein